MKRIYLLIIGVCLFLGMGSVSADTVNSVYIVMHLHENGNADVMLNWDGKKTEGTEWFIQYLDLDKTTISNFQVSVNDKKYNYIDNWDINAGLNDKAYKNGFNYIDNGVELCWGANSYSRAMFNLTYTLNNVIYQYDDKQVLYFGILPSMPNEVKNVNLAIYNIKTDDVEFSTYGYVGKNDIKDGYITSQGTIKEGEYMTILAAFPNNTFNLNFTKPGTFNDVKALALKGATPNSETSLLDKIMHIINVVVFLMLALILIKRYRGREIYKNDFEINKKNINNFRDIPFNKKMQNTFYIGTKKLIIKREHILGAYILKWIKEDKIKIIPTEGDGILDFNKNDNYYMDITNLNGVEEIELLFVNLIKMVAIDNKISPKQFKNWIMKNPQIINNYLNNALEISKKSTIQDGYIVEGSELYSKNKSRVVYTYSKELKEETEKLAGLKKFLEDMSLINEKKSIEVKVWEEYLIYAELFGIADKVRNQFKEFHKMEYEQNQTYYDSFSYTNHVVKSITSSISSAGSASSYSGGGGGSVGGGGSCGGR